MFSLGTVIYVESIQYFFSICGGGLPSVSMGTSPAGPTPIAVGTSACEWNQALHFMQLPLRVLSPHFRRVFSSIACSRRVSANVEHKRPHLVCTDGRGRFRKCLVTQRVCQGDSMCKNRLTSTVYTSAHDRRLFHTEGALNRVYRSTVTPCVYRACAISGGAYGLLATRYCPEQQLQIKLVKDEPVIHTKLCTTK